MCMSIFLQIIKDDEKKVLNMRYLLSLMIVFEWKANMSN